MRSIVAIIAAMIGISAVFGGDANPFSPASVPHGKASVRLDVNPGNSMLLIDAKVDGHPCRLIFDTGATHTTLDRAFVRDVLKRQDVQPVDVTGDTNVEERPGVFKVESFVIGDAAFGAFMMMSLDLSRVSRSVGKEVHGVLGMNVIASTPMLLSVKDSVAVFNPEKEIARDFPPPVKSLTFEAPVFAAEKNGRKFPVLVDSGSSITYMTEGFWPVDEAAPAAAIGATDVNGSGAIGGKPGIEGRFDAGPAFTIRPLVAARSESTIGSDTLRSVDMLMRLPYISFRERK